MAPFTHNPRLFIGHGVFCFIVWLIRDLGLILLMVGGLVLVGCGESSSNLFQ